MSEVIAQHTRRAAHGKHRCGLCHGMIAARARYIDQRVADSGTVYTWRHHLECQGIIDELWRRDYEAMLYTDEIGFAWFRETLEENEDLRQFVPCGPLALTEGEQ